MADVGTELSEREREVLRLVATGASNKQIARRLAISPNTVKVHLRNIFAKTGAASRTGAALYAVRIGLVPVEKAAGVQEAALVDRSRAKEHARAWRQAGVAGFMLVVLVLLVVTAATWLRRRAGVVADPSPSPDPELARWQFKAPMPTARSGLAAAVFEGKIYAIGGETDQGVTGVNERYDPATDTWEILPSKPVPVADIGAAVVGGRIYVPGGRLSSWAPTDVVEVYDPLRGVWEQAEPLPKPISAYALAAFEGKIYLFGGWDGQGYVADAYAYDPDEDLWRELPPMPTARGFAGAAVLGGHIFVLGGRGVRGALPMVEEFGPENERNGLPSWATLRSMPVASQHGGVASLSDALYAVTEVGGSAQGPVLLRYLPQMNEWETLQDLPFELGSGFGLVAFLTNLHVMGGGTEAGALSQNLTFQAIFVITLPIIR